MLRYFSGSIISIIVDIDNDLVLPVVYNRGVLYVCHTLLEILSPHAGDGVAEEGSHRGDEVDHQDALQ